MKLSKFKNLSWMIALCSAGVSSFLTFQVLNADSAKNHLAEWEPKNPELENFKNARNISEEKLIHALTFLTNIEEKRVKADTLKEKKIDDHKIPENIEPIKLKLPISLTFIAFKDKNQKHVAFIKENSKTAHPYFEGDYLIDIQQKVQLYKINKNNVIVKNEQGLKQKLNLKTQLIKRSGFINQRQNLFQHSGQKNKAIKSSKTALQSQTNKFRRVPKYRRVSKNKDYDIDIIEYIRSGKDRSFAITEKHQKVLENNQMRILSDFNANPVYKTNGEIQGVKIDFMVDKPLLKNYGFSDGDIVTHINDIEINSVIEGQKIYDKLSPNDRRVKIQKLDKNNKKMIIYFEMDDFPNVPAK
jgi:type II secretory pathway component PulC